MAEISLRPVISPDSRPYWDGLRRHQLLLQRCASCATTRHYPRPLCDRCLSFAVDWISATGEGSLHSWTVAHHPFHPAFRDTLPYIIATVDLIEGVRIVAQLRHNAGETLSTGMALRISFQDIDPEFTLPVVELVPSAVAT